MEDLALVRVVFAHRPEELSADALVEGALDHGLGEVARSEILTPLDGQHLLAHAVVTRDRIADLQSGGKTLGERAGDEYGDGSRLPREQRGNRPGFVEVEISIRDVLENRDVQTLVIHRLQKVRLLLPVERETARIREVADQIDRPDARPLTARLELREESRQLAGGETVVSSRHGDRVDAESSQEIEEDEVSRRLDENDIPRRAQRLYGHV